MMIDKTTCCLLYTLLQRHQNSRTFLIHYIVLPSNDISGTARDLTRLSLQFGFISLGRSLVSSLYLFSLFSGPIDAPVAKHFQSADASTTKRRWTQPLATNQFIQVRSLHTTNMITATHGQICCSEIQPLPPAAQNYKISIFRNSANHALGSFDTVTNPTTCRLAQPFLSIAQKSKNSSFSLLCVEIRRLRIELDCTLLDSVAATSDPHFP